MQSCTKVDSALAVEEDVSNWAKNGIHPVSLKLSVAGHPAKTGSEALDLVVEVYKLLLMNKF
jgi:hypothetical protein